MQDRYREPPPATTSAKVRVVAATNAVRSFGGRPRRAGGAADTGAGPVCGLRRSTKIRCYCPPTSTSKVFSPASATA